MQDMHQFLKELVKRGLVLHISVQLDPSSTNYLAQLHVQVVDLLLEFDYVFAIPTGLPPLRGYEHQINLKEGAQAICQRPYKYPYYQKNEI